MRVWQLLGYLRSVLGHVLLEWTLKGNFIKALEGFGCHRALTTSCESLSRMINNLAILWEDGYNGLAIVVDIKLQQQGNELECSTF